MCPAPGTGVTVPGENAPSSRSHTPSKIMLAVAPHPSYNLPMMDFDHLVMPDDHLAMLTLGVDDSADFGGIPGPWHAYDTAFMNAADDFGFNDPNDPMDEI